MSELKTAFRGIKVEEAYTEAASFKGIALKTGLLLLIAVFSGVLLPYAIPTGYLLYSLIGAVIGALICGIVGQISVKAAPVCSIIYAVCEGLLLGLISYVFEAVMGIGGIVLTAVLLTATIFVAMLLVYSTRLIKVTSKFAKMMFGMMVAIISFSLLYWILGMIKPDNMLASAFANNPWIAIIFALFILVYAALMLMLDFNHAEKLVTQGFAKRYEWTAALSLMITIVWIYVQVLRILAIFMRRK